MYNKFLIAHGTSPRGIDEQKLTETPIQPTVHALTKMKYGNISGLFFGRES